MSVLHTATRKSEPWDPGLDCRARPRCRRVEGPLDAFLAAARVGWWTVWSWFRCTTMSYQFGLDCVSDCGSDP